VPDRPNVCLSSGYLGGTRTGAAFSGAQRSVITLDVAGAAAGRDIDDYRVPALARAYRRLEQARFPADFSRRGAGVRHLGNSTPN
jgi:hypothetical protein